MSLDPQKTGIICSSLNTTSKHAPQVESKIKLYAKQPMENHRGPTPNEKSPGVKG